MAVELGIIDKRGAYFSYNETRLGQGRENAKSFLRENPDLMGEICARVREVGFQGLVTGQPVASFVDGDDGDDLGSD